MYTTVNESRIKNSKDVDVSFKVLQHNFYNEHYIIEVRISDRFIEEHIVNGTKYLPSKVQEVQNKWLRIIGIIENRKENGV